MRIEYITLMKDYNHGRQKGLKKLVGEIEDRLICALCVEKVQRRPVRFKHIEPFATQIMWNLI